MKSIENVRTRDYTVCFYLHEGVEVLDFAGPMEAFAVAGFKIFTVSKNNPVTSQGVLKIIPDYDLTNAPEADIIIVFGGNAWNAYNDTDVIAWIKSRERQTEFFLSVCSGAFILAKAGLLDGLTITTYHKRVIEFRKAFPGINVLSNVRFVDNGRVITTAGVSAGIDGALHLIARLKGEQAAQDAVAYMEYDRWVPNRGLVLSSNV